MSRVVVGRVVVGIVSAVVIAAGLMFLFVADPAQVGFIPPCPVHGTIGLYCPGCGSLRATHQLLHGHLLRAIQYNVALLPALITLAAIWGSQRIRVCPATPKVLLIALVFFGILRNLPMWPFFLLAPH